MMLPRILTVCLIAISITSCASGKVTVEDARTLAKRIGPMCYSQKVLDVMSRKEKERALLFNRTFFGEGACR